MLGSPPKSTLAVLACVLAGVLGVLGALQSDTVAARSAALARAVPQRASELAGSAGFVGEDGGRLIPKPLKVQVVQGGGELWVGRTIVAALEGDRFFEADASPHLMRVESIHAQRGFAVQTKLWRVGLNDDPWDLRLNAPLRRRMQPELFALPVALGAFIWLLLGRLSWGVFVAGTGVLAGLAFTPVGPSVSWDSLVGEVSLAPMWVSLSSFVARNELATTATAASVIVFCLVLAFFDHRQSREKEGALTVPRAFFDAIALGVGGLCLVEGALRSGWWDALQGGWGWLGAMGLATACVIAGVGASRARASTS